MYSGCWDSRQTKYEMKSVLLTNITIEHTGKAYKYIYVTHAAQIITKVETACFYDLSNIFSMVYKEPMTITS